MSRLILVANTITGNEKAWGLLELHLQSPGNGGVHRYQIIAVTRDGRIAQWRKDMGLAKNFRGVKQLLIPSELEHTVDELMDLAEQLRNETDIDIKDWLELDRMKLA